MKFRILATILLFVVLGVCYILYESNQSTPTQNNQGVTIN